MAIRSGESAEDSYVGIFGEDSRPQAKSRARKLLEKTAIINRIEEFQEKAERATQIARTDDVVSKEAFEKFIWDAMRSKPSEISEDSEFAEMKYDKEGNMLATKPSVVGLGNLLAHVKGWKKSGDTTILLPDWSPSKIRDVSPKMGRLEE